MYKKELEEKLNQINEQLSSLGDLNNLVEQGNNLPGLVNEVNQQKDVLTPFIDELPKHKEEFQDLLSKTRLLKDQLFKKKRDVGKITEKVEVLNKKAETLSKEVMAQLGIVANEKLANAFNIVKHELNKEKNKWFGWLYRAVIVLVAITSFIVFWQVQVADSLYELSFLIKISLTSPIVYFIVFLNREYSRSRSLVEEYTFKEAIARSFEAYNEIIESSFSEYQAEIYKRKLTFILKSVRNLYSSPMQNIKKNRIKEKFNSPDMVTGLKEIVLPNNPE